MYTKDLGLSSYKQSLSQIEFKTDKCLELFRTKKEDITNIFIIFIPILTLLAPMIWSFYNGLTLVKNILIISIPCIIGMILEYILISSLDSVTNISEVKIIFSSNGIEIDSKKRGIIKIEQYNVKKIYIDSEESNADSSSQNSKSTYHVICELNKPITVEINKKNFNEIKLFGDFGGQENLNTARKIVSDMKRILNIRENLNINEEIYFSTKRTTFEKHQNEIKISTSTIEGFFNDFDIIDLLFIIILLISIIYGFMMAYTTTKIIIVIISIISYIVLYIIYKVNITPKNIIYTITPNEIKLDTEKKQSLIIKQSNINKIYIDRIKKWVSTGKHSGYYVHYDNIIISLKKSIFLYPINISQGKKVNLLGNIKLVNSDYAQIIKQELKKMLRIN